MNAAAAPLTFPEMDDSWLRRHRSHDVTHLLQRWRAVARTARLKVHVMHETAGFPVYGLISHNISSNPLYISSGVHGDEAGSALGLLEWAEKSISWLRSADVLCVPVFNPVGLALNTRTDADSQDLNRMFDHPVHPHIVGWRQFMTGFQPRLAVCLHEDYDAQGLYAYELNRDTKLRLAERCLAKAEAVLPRDLRRTIEGRPAQAAIIRRRRLPMVQDLPEAVALYQKGTPCTLTFETPSEYALSARVRAHMMLLQAITDWDDSRRGKA